MRAFVASKTRVKPPHAPRLNAHDAPTCVRVRAGGRVYGLWAGVPGLKGERWPMLMLAALLGAMMPWLIVLVANSPLLHPGARALQSGMRDARADCVCLPARLAVPVCLLSSLLVPCYHVCVCERESIHTHACTRMCACVCVRACLPACPQPACACMCVWTHVHMHARVRGGYGEAPN